MNNSNQIKTLLAATSLCFAVSAYSAGVKIDNVILGKDNNSAENPFVQPQDPALSGGGRDQSMQFGDVLFGNQNEDDLIIGALGIDLLFGSSGNDVLMGGIEHFNPLNRDRAFGGPGNDIFIWKPGDGSDLFRGASGSDAIIFGITGELVGGVRKFEVLNDQLSAEVALNEKTNLPKVDVTNSPGFCEVTDKNSESGSRKQLNDLGLDHFARFFIRSIADDFERRVQTDDNGLRVTLHLNSVEYLVCTERVGGVVEILNLQQSPPVRVDIDEVQPQQLRNRIKRIIK